MFTFACWMQIKLTQALHASVNSSYILHSLLFKCITLLKNSVICLLYVSFDVSNISCSQKEDKPVFLTLLGIVNVTTHFKVTTMQLSTVEAHLLRQIKNGGGDDQWHSIGGGCILYKRSKPLRLLSEWLRNPFRGTTNLLGGTRQTTLPPDTHVYLPKKG